MGRVRPGHIKRAAKNLMDKYPHLFSDKFEENRDTLNKLLNTDSKKVRNRIAGYITSNYKSLKKTHA